jgi:hypothetical protein
VLARCRVPTIAASLATLAVASAPGCAPAPPVVAPGAISSQSPPHAAPDPAEITEIEVEFRPGGPPLPGATERAIRLLRPAPGELGSREFDRLARWLVARGYFDLRDRYGGPEPSDCGSVLLTVVYGNKSKSVLNYCGRGDEPTWEFETMIRGVASALDRMRSSGRRDRPA